jgi:putative sigma-54 modulation protein
VTFDLRGHHLSVSNALRRHAERRLAFGLRRFDRWIGGVKVRISDVNGPRGGMDKSCQIMAEMLPTGLVRVEATDSDAYVVIDRAADRLEQAVRRHVWRIRDARRGRESIRQAEVFAQLRRMCRGPHAGA